MLEKIQKLNKAASLIGGSLLFLLGTLMMTSDSMSIGGKDDPTKATQLSQPVRIVAGILLAVIGLIIFIANTKKRD